MNRPRKTIERLFSRQKRRMVSTVGQSDDGEQDEATCDHHAVDGQHDPRAHARRLPLWAPTGQCCATATVTALGGLTVGATARPVPPPRSPGRGAHAAGQPPRRRPWFRLVVERAVRRVFAGLGRVEVVGSVGRNRGPSAPAHRRRCGRGSGRRCAARAGCRGWSPPSSRRRRTRAGDGRWPRRSRRRRSRAGRRARPVAGGRAASSSPSRTAVVLRPGRWTVVTRTPLPSCMSSQRSESANARAACLAEQYVACSGMAR